MKAQEEIDEKLMKPRHFLQASAAIIGKYRWAECLEPPDSPSLRLRKWG
jgi:hypothetical protein